MRKSIALGVVLALLCGAPAFAAGPAESGATPDHVTVAAPTPPIRRTTDHAAADRPGSDRAAADRGSRGGHQRAKPLTMILDSISPASVGPRSTVRVSGRLVNTSGTTITGTSVRFRYSNAPVRSRGDLNAYAQGVTGTADPPLISPTPHVVRSLSAGQAQRFTLRIAAKVTGITEFGVYPIAIEVVDGVGRQVTKQRTFLTYVPKGARPRRTKVSWVWPIVDRPRRTGDATFLDDRLQRELAEGGRLAGLVAAAKSTRTPITWAVDPAVVDDARAMAASGGYTLADSTHRPASAAAGRWLADLRAAVDGKPMFALPYADPDSVALVQANMEQDVKDAITAGLRVIQEKDALARQPSASVSWPADGALDQATLNELTSNGGGTLLLGSDAVPPVRPDIFTPDAASTFTSNGRQVRGLAYDSTLSRIIGAGSRGPGRAVLVQQRFLAETAMITGELPNQSRTVVIAPPRDWNPAPDLAKRLLSYTHRASWLRSVPLSEIEQSTSRTARTVVYPASAARAELGQRYLREVKRLGRDIDRLSSTFADQRGVFDLGIPRMESSAWRGMESRAVRMRRQLTEDVEADRRRVRVINDSVGLAGTRGIIPVTIANDLASETVTVRLRARSMNTERLEIGVTDSAQDDKTPCANPSGPGWTNLDCATIDPERKVIVKIPMQAFANGVTLVDLQLLTPDGTALGPATVLRVRATGYGRTALLITGSALAVLFLGIGLRVLRARRHH